MTANQTATSPAESSTQGSSAESPSLITVLLRGIMTHFDVRAPSWFMSSLMLGVGMALTVNPKMFEGPLQGYFVYMTRFAGQGIWAGMFIGVALARILALFVNGSIPSITWTPMIRAITGAIASVMWLQVFISVSWGRPVGIALFTYLIFMLADIYNTYKAAAEMPRRG